MSCDAERQAIETRFNTVWTSATPVAWNNVDYTPSAGTSFVALRILPGPGRFASLGRHPLHRYTGLIEISVMTPAGGGTSPGRTLTGNVLAVFRDVNGNGWQGGGITCKAGYLSHERQEKEWLKQIVIVPFTRDETF